MSETNNNKFDTLKTLSVGVVGTFSALTLERYSLIASAAAATLTALYMLFKCIDWLITVKGRTRNKSKTSNSTDE